MTNCSTLISELKSWKDIEKLPQREKKPWIAASQKELDSLEENNMWKLIDLPYGKKSIDSKYKTRLVAKGYSKKYGEDYDKVFTHVLT